MVLTLRRDELTAELRTGKLLLLDEQDFQTARREMNRRAASGWTSAGDYDVIVVLHPVNTSRAGK